MIKCIYMKETSYNKKGTFNFQVECLPILVRHLITNVIRCRFFIHKYYNTKVKSRPIRKKIIITKQKIIQSFIFIITIRPPFLDKIGGRHPTIKCSYKYYSKQLFLKQ